MRTITPINPYNASVTTTTSEKAGELRSEDVSPFSLYAKGFENLQAESMRRGVLAVGAPEYQRGKTTANGVGGGQRARTRQASGPTCSTSCARVRRYKALKTQCSKSGCEPHILRWCAVTMGSAGIPAQMSANIHVRCGSSFSISRITRSQFMRARCCGRFLDSFQVSGAS